MTSKTPGGASGIVSSQAWARKSSPAPLTPITTSAGRAVLGVPALEHQRAF